MCDYLPANARVSVSVPILNLFSGGLWAIRSFVSQLVESHEQGK